MDHLLIVSLPSRIKRLGVNQANVLLQDENVAVRTKKREDPKISPRGPHMILITIEESAEEGHVIDVVTCLTCRAASRRHRFSRLTIVFYFGEFLRDTIVKIKVLSRKINFLLFEVKRKLLCDVTAWRRCSIALYRKITTRDANLKTARLLLGRVSSVHDLTQWQVLLRNQNLLDPDPPGSTSLLLLGISPSMFNLSISSPNQCFRTELASLSQQTPGRLVLVTLQFGVDDGAGSAADGQLLSGLHLVMEVSEPALRIHLKLLLQRGGNQAFNTLEPKLYLNRSESQNAQWDSPAVIYSPRSQETNQLHYPSIFTSISFNLFPEILIAGLT